MALTPERKKEIEEEEAYRLKARKKAKRDKKAREWGRGFVGLVVIVGVVWGAIELFGDEEEKQKARTAGLSSEQTSKIRKSLDFLSQVKGVAWFDVKGPVIHIGIEGGESLALDVLRGAVGNAVGAIDRSHPITAYAYSANRISGPRENGEGATCKAEGKDRVERIRCLRAGAWVKPEAVRR